MRVTTAVDQLFEGFLASCNDHDLDRIREQTAPRVLLNGVERDHEEFLREIERLYEAFPDQTWEVERRVNADPWVTVVLRTRGRQAGGWHGLAPTGKSVEGCEIDLCRFEDGLLREVWTVGDELPRFLELSAEPLLG